MNKKNRKKFLLINNINIKIKFKTKNKKKKENGYSN